MGQGAVDICGDCGPGFPKVGGDYPDSRFIKGVSGSHPHPADDDRVDVTDHGDHPRVAIGGVVVEAVARRGVVATLVVAVVAVVVVVVVAVIAAGVLATLMVVVVVVVAVARRGVVTVVEGSGTVPEFLIYDRSIFRGEHLVVSSPSEVLSDRGPVIGYNCNFH
jgi:hypothetical protein